MQTYCLLPQAKSIDVTGGWAEVLPFSHVVGYSHLGHLFLFDENTHEFAVFYPFRRAWKNYGRFDDLAQFESTILQDEGFAQYVLKPEHQQAIQQLVGELGEEEVYIPQPYPHLGGDESPSSYGKGNVWVFVELVGMTFQD